MRTLICSAPGNRCGGNRSHTYSILCQYFIISVKKLTSLCLFDLLKLPSSSLNPLILLGKPVYWGQDSLQYIKLCIHVMFVTLKSVQMALY